jgi:hypothetical protein
VVLFANEKRTKETQPVMRGFLTFNGTEYEVSLWGNTSPKGTKYWKGTFKEKQEQREAAPAPALSKTSATKFRSDDPLRPTCGA